MMPPFDGDGDDCGTGLAIAAATMVIGDDCGNGDDCYALAISTATKTITAATMAIGTNVGRHGHDC